ncbi:NAD-dependent epimerase/dehydratase family protein [Hymenobacter sp. ASUV-10]|uniref:NAD-dependent epimerase/dehydratase family protein n=1 Tax=Hymenobacter aranciens TaxID=3063996 RepID=A0ABT9BKW6_9BACT|nr:NAD-dependent epimerase/dehydratase family protein [Hymenobacter sp. ASUV-10]MDO7877301.1 NAD-dependent epimerase/dehydratase family protein [Hymenobacter sp. ASUV-10]
MKTALLAGATGLIGSQLLPLLLASDRYSKVTVVGRRELPLSHPKLTQVVTGLDRLELVREQLVADDVYCCLGTTMAQAGSKEAFYKVDFGYVVTLAALTSAPGAQFLVVSSLNPDPQSMFYYSRVKGEMEAAVRKLGFRAIHIFRPSLLLGRTEKVRTGEQVASVVMAALRPLLRGPLREWRAIEGSAVARAMLRAAAGESSGVRVHSSAEMQSASEG